MEKWLERARKYGTYVVVGACVLAWAVVFKSGWGNSEWTGLWSSGEKTRGSSVVIKEKVVETTEERHKRQAKYLRGVAQKRELDEKLRELRTEFLGNKSPTRGDPLRFQQRIPKDVARYTQRDVCFQMQLEEPERYKDIDCMSDQYDDKEPWFKAPHR